MKKKRLYVGQLIAFLNTPDRGAISEAVPFFELFESLEQARDAAEAELLRICPISSGWFGHSARILTQTKELMDDLVEAYRAGQLDRETPSEADTDYQFDARIGQTTNPSKLEWPEEIG